MTKKLTLKIEDLEDRIAPALVLPNEMVLFLGFDNAAPGPFHPSLMNGVEEHSNGQAAGPWSATELFGGPLGFSDA